MMVVQDLIIQARIVVEVMRKIVKGYQVQW